ncbi:hypothetical protein DRW03_22205 [Corallococcus sp. H22C18031201]|uniref:flagellar assembly protein T N-terminal domain-containing protein n=1 Tax=Citreicoccus inhibens TaxID=2849499 RepID=UPI000E746269|nr:flagellar assembly protein T N-terminal domain-containing protein [Citreicoccus inhibens]MBU8897111.1 flagellar assembly protein T N-terminal domain-containing protein [Citreicoccus inhibens]RJS19729.1 hypothetical protein DRW03_22205 [Corallococcus sp. H22C18031201]
MSWKLSVLCVLLSCVAVAAEPSVPATVVKEATGEAAIVDGNREKAFTDARNAALREAVEQVAGVLVSSDTLTANSQLLSDRVFTNSAGYVRKYEVLGRKEEGGVTRVTVRAEVGTADLDKDLQAAQALVRRLGGSKLLIVLSEQSISPDKVITSSSVLTQVLTETFRKDGWRIIDPSFAAGKLEVSSGVSLSTPDKKIIQDLSVADYVISGTVTFRHEGVQGTTKELVKDVGYYPVAGEWELAVFATDSGTQLARLTDAFNSGNASTGQAPVTSYERTSFNIAKVRGAKIVAEVRKAVLEHLAQAEQNGNVVAMTVVGLSDYAAVRAFQKVLTQSVQGVRDVKAGEFAEGKARFDVTYVGGTDALAESLGATTYQKRKVRVTAVSGNRVELTVAR